MVPIEAVVQVMQSCEDLFVEFFFFFFIELKTIANLGVSKAWCSS